MTLNRINNNPQLRHSVVDLAQRQAPQSPRMTRSRSQSERLGLPELLVERPSPVPARRNTMFNRMASMARHSGLPAFAQGVACGIHSVGVGATLLGNVEILNGIFRNNYDRSLRGLMATAAGAFLLSGEYATQCLIRHYFGDREVNEEDLQQQLNQLRLHPECLFEATNMVTFFDEAVTGPPMNEGEALIVADHLYDLMRMPIDEIEQELLECVAQADNNPRMLVAKLLDIVRDPDPIIPSSGRSLTPQ